MPDLITATEARQLVRDHSDEACALLAEADQRIRAAAKAQSTTVRLQLGLRTTADDLARARAELLRCGFHVTGVSHGLLVSWAADA